MTCPPARIAVLGGGQLGLMIGLAAIPLGLEPAFLDPSPDACAGAVGRLVTGALDDLEAAREAARGADVVTYEWEGVPAATARTLAEQVPVRPGAAALTASQDRLVEKETFGRLGIPTAAFAAVDDHDDLERAVERLGFPAVLKTRRGGYDGKGQRVLGGPTDLDRARSTVGNAPLLVEAHVAFRRELSILAARALDGSTACWPVVENTHRGGILRVSRAPAAVDDALRERAESYARALLDALDYVGVLCVELFDTGDTLLANELAPRVHNSGHWTIDGAITSQFENHVRAVAGLPLGSTGARGACAMVNCIGGMPDRAALLAIPGAHLHDYRKAPRPGRKLGHVTLCAEGTDDLADRLDAVLALVEGATVDAPA